MATTRVKVGSHRRNPTHDISLSDGVYTFGFRLDGGAGALTENPASPSTIGSGGGVGTFGDGDPNFMNVEQRDWRDGSGILDFSSLNAGFADSMNAFTMLENRLIPAMQWKIASGTYKTKATVNAGNMDWFALHSGNSRYISQTFTPAVNITADKYYNWIKRVGTPGDLTASLCSNSGGSPSTVLKSTTITAASVADIVSVFQKFDWTTTEALSSGTVYHIKFSAASGDTAADHWEIGINYAVSGAKISSDDSAWSTPSPTFSIPYHVVPADVNLKYLPFTLLGGKYVVTIFDNTATASTVFMQGDRGVATSSTATTIVDSARSWTTDEWVGCTVEIVEGTGVGQQRLITANTSTALTVATWDVNPDTTSAFVILGSNKWTEVSTTGLGAVKDVETLNNVAYFAQGTSVNVRRMRYDVSSKAHGFAADGTNKADALLALQHAVDGPQMWRAQNNVSNVTSVARASGQVWGTDLTFGTAIPVGGIGGTIIDMTEYDNSLWVFRTDQPYNIVNDKAVPALKQMKFIPSATNGLGAVVHDVMLFIPWAGFTLQQFYGGSLNDATRKRMPSGRGGHYSSGVSIPQGLLEAIDAGSGTSSVQFRNDERLGWHEVFRAWEAGRRIRSIWWEHVPLGRPKLWMNVGDELIYQEWAMGTFDPLQDSGVNYQHETVVEMSAIDLRAVSLPKYIEEIRLISQNLTANIKVGLDYQIDNAIGTSTWTENNEFLSSPEAVEKIERGDIRKIKFRLRLMTNDSDVPPVVLGAAIKGFTRTPFKRYWTMRVTLSDTQRTLSGGKDHKPIDIINWLQDVLGRAQEINARSRWADFDDQSVIVDSYTQRREYITRDNKVGLVVFVTVREA